MGYSSFYDSDTRIPPASMDPSLPRYDLLHLWLSVYDNRDSPLYILGIQRVDNTLVQRLKQLKGVQAVVPMGDFIDFVVRGLEEDVQVLGEEIYHLTNQRVGCIRYDKERYFSQAELEWAVEDAIRQRVPIHIAEPQYHCSIELGHSRTINGLLD